MKKRISASKPEAPSSRVGTRWEDEVLSTRPRQTSRCTVCFAENGTHLDNCPNEFPDDALPQPVPMPMDDSIPGLARSVVAALLRRLANTIDPPGAL